MEMNHLFDIYLSDLHHQHTLTAQSTDDILTMLVTTLSTVYLLSPTTTSSYLHLTMLYIALYCTVYNRAGDLTIVIIVFKIK